MQSMGENFWRLIGAIEVWVVSWNDVGSGTLVRVDIHPQQWSSEVTTELNLSLSRFKKFKECQSQRHPTLQTHSYYSNVVGLLWSSIYAINCWQNHLSPSISSMSSRVIIPSPKKICKRPSGPKSSCPPKCFLWSSATSIKTRPVLVSTWLGFFLQRNIINLQYTLRLFHQVHCLYISNYLAFGSWQTQVYNNSWVIIFLFIKVKNDFFIIYLQET